MHPPPTESAAKDLAEWAGRLWAQIPGAPDVLKASLLGQSIKEVQGFKMFWSSWHPEASLLRLNIMQMHGFIRFSELRASWKCPCCAGI